MRSTVISGAERPFATSGAERPFATSGAERPGVAQARDDAAEVRCPCGALLARRAADNVEIKCRRCKAVTAVGAGDTASGAALRCACNALLGVGTERGVETKCRRCKRVARVA